jgi:serine/threonine protein kinase
MQAQSQPDFTGFLKKKGAINLNYQQRWFELVGPRLFYYKDNKVKTPAGVILLKNCSLSKDKKNKSLFLISGPHLKRTYELQAGSEQEADQWIAAVNTLIQGKGKLSESEAKEEKQELKNKSETVEIEGLKTKQKKVSLEDFDLLCVLGRGSFGKVMKVRKKDTKEIYAMKILAKEMLIKQNMINYTKQENAILQGVDHPFIVGLRFAFQTDSKLYLVLDFLSGGELFFHLSKEVKFNVDRTRYYAAELVLALGHLHSKDIVYRDLKPENVVLDQEGHCVMTDFGLAKKDVSNNNPTTTFCGTPEYLAPEIIKGKGYSKPVDWWSLGILIYEMLVGLPPFYSENINEMYELILKAPLKFPSFVPSEAQSLLKGLLERDEAKRLGSGSGDYKEIQNHSFFAPIDWDKLYARKVTPPFVPEKQKEGEDDRAVNFDSEFTSERAVESFAKSVKDDKDGNFDGFDYASEKKK